jgi:hypothetical protein
MSPPEDPPRRSGVTYLCDGPPGIARSMTVYTLPDGKAVPIVVTDEGAYVLNVGSGRWAKVTAQ